MTRPYMSPFLWTALGFLGGWLYAKPNVLLAVVWAAANLAMMAWIMRDFRASYGLSAKDHAHDERSTD